MTRSTVTWYSKTFKPQDHAMEQFLLAITYNNGSVIVALSLYHYDEFSDSFKYGNEVVPRKEVTYWAYVPRVVYLGGESGKQSQVPEEK